jgi:hypothetical protein
MRKKRRDSLPYPVHCRRAKLHVLYNALRGIQVAIETAESEEETKQMVNRRELVQAEICRRAAPPERSYD